MYNISKLVRDKKFFLISGETGSGKSTYAKKIHKQYDPDSPFIHVNITSLSENLFESELFGHIKGSFTGASESKKGLLCHAGQGTLFIDEVGDLSLGCQAKILHILEEREYFPVGGREKKKFKGRIIFATHRCLKTALEKGEIREDFYYRVTGIELEIAPLREQRAHILEALMPYKKNIKREEFAYLVEHYDWPGNYRQLKQVVERIQYAELDRPLSCFELGMAKSKVGSLSVAEADQYYEALEYFERTYFKDKMEKFNGRVNYASAQMGLSKSTLIAKLKKYGISSLKIRAMNEDAQPSFLKAV